MKIIILKTKEGLGKIGEIINVKPGYARNFLIPKKFAKIATENNVKALKLWVNQEELKEAKNRENMDALSKYLNKLTLKFSLQAGEDEKLFGSVTSQMISDELENQGYSIDKKEIILEEPIKHAGNHFINIKLSTEISAKVKIKVSAEK